MDYAKIGELIRAERRARKLTQAALADRLHLTDKTVSKWERGLGCPDVSLLPALAEALHVNVDRLLAGELSEKQTDGGNMKKLKFYVCPHCGGITTATGEADISCCGRTLAPLKAQKADDCHKISVEVIDDEDYITLSHDMLKEHFISFVAYVTWDRAMLVRLYPEQEAACRMPRLRGGKIYAYCSRDGLFVND